MPQKKRILVCPLDWGLGHATRCIPIIQLLLKNEAEVIIGGSGRSLSLLKQEFPQLEFIGLPGYDIKYDAGSLALKAIFSISRILKAIRIEHLFLEKVVREKQIDLVISDNCFGLWSKQVKSVFITHQLMIKAPFAERLLHIINLSFIKRYSECWIPDFPGTMNLSGDLSHKYTLPEKTFFIGPLSRLQELPVLSGISKLKSKYDVLILISGPETQRSIFEDLILKQARSIPLDFLIVRGMPEIPKTLEIHLNIDIVSHLNAIEMKTAMLSADIIVCRSGYSSLMDLWTLKRKVIFVPTPGQTEQEYLAEKCMQEGIAYFEKQSKFNLTFALEKSREYKGFSKLETLEEHTLEKRVELLLST